MIVKFFSLLLVLLLSAACNQTTLGVGTAVKNFFTLPFKAIQSIHSENAYKEEKKKTEEAAQSEGQSASDSEIQYCLDSQGNPEVDTHMKNLGDVLKLTCQCKAWGTCVKELCSCQKLCPDNFNIFKRPPFEDTQEMTRPENGLAFRLGKSQGSFKEEEGYCWGHARVSSQFNRLAFFKPDATPPYKLGSADSEEENKAIKYYKGIIDKITNNEATEIPGFKNLQEFSANPALQSYLGDKVAKSWANEAMSLQGMKVGLGTKSLSKGDYQRVISEIKEKLSFGVQPTVVYTRVDSPFYSHALLISHTLKKPNEGEVLCLRDSGVAEERNFTCNNYIKLNDDGLVIEPYGRRVGKIEVAHNENPDMVKQKYSLLERCKRDKNCSH